MNPNIAAAGGCFKGAFLYYMHDPKALTRDRIAWAETVNMLTIDPDKAWKVMAYTAKHQARLKQAAGVKATKPVMAYSLSWKPGRNPDREHMREMALQSLSRLGMRDHEALIVAHQDTPHRHVHVIVNRIHPLTGKVANDHRNQTILSDFCDDYAMKHDLNDSPQRRINHAKREAGEYTRYRDPKIAQAWTASHDGQSFAAALSDEGYCLTHGWRGYVVVDPYGNIRAPARMIDGIQAKDVWNRCRDLSLESLPDADLIAKQHRAKHEAKKRATQQRSEAVKRSFNTNGLQPVTPNHPPQMNPDFATASRIPPNDTASSSEAAQQSASNNANTQQAKAAEQQATQRPDKPLISRSQQHDLERFQDRQWREQDELKRHHRRQLDREKKHLALYYDLAAQKSAIKDLQTKCRQPALWRRVLGLATRDRKQLKALKLTYADARNRYDEKISTLENRHAEASEHLRTTHQKEYERRYHTILNSNEAIDRAQTLAQQQALRRPRGMSM